jgi:hypothetical protein
MLEVEVFIVFSESHVRSRSIYFKQVNIYSLFVREYITRISQVQKLQNSKLLAKIRENIEM